MMLKLALFLFTGVAVSVAIAWCGAMFDKWPFLALSTPGFFEEPTPGSPRPVERFSAEATRVEWMHYVTARAPARHIVDRVEYMLLARGETPGTAEWPPVDPPGISVYSAGWPMRALEWSECLQIRSGQMRSPVSGVEAAWEFGIACRTHGARSNHAWRRLPIRPSGGGVGLAVNTAVWGAVAALVCAGPGALRRRRRGARGECLECGYPLRDTSGRAMQQCPECGAAVTPTPPPMPDTGSPA